MTTKKKTLCLSIVIAVVTLIAIWPHLKLPFFANAEYDLIISEEISSWPLNSVPSHYKVDSKTGVKAKIGEAEYKNEGNSNKFPDYAAKNGFAATSSGYFDGDKSVYVTDAKKKYDSKIADAITDPQEVCHIEMNTYFMAKDYDDDDTNNSVYRHNKSDQSVVEIDTSQIAELGLRICNIGMIDYYQGLSDKIIELKESGGYLFEIVAGGSRVFIKARRNGDLNSFRDTRSISIYEFNQNDKSLNRIYNVDKGGVSLDIYVKQ
jgi:hypothetical protein